MTRKVVFTVKMMQSPSHSFFLPLPSKTSGKGALHTMRTYERGKKSNRRESIDSCREKGVNCEEERKKLREREMENNG